MPHLRKIAIVAVGVLIIVIIAFAFQPWSKRSNTSMNEKSVTGPVTQAQITLVLCKKDVAKGAVFTNDDLEVVRRSMQKYPQDAISDPGEVVGKVAKYGIRAGSMVGYHDVGEGGHP